MFRETDQPEETQPNEIEEFQIDSNRMARLREVESEAELLNCEHLEDTDAWDTAVDRSARWMDKWDKTDDPIIRRYLLERVGREMMRVHEAPPGSVYPQEMPRNELGAYSEEDFRTDVNQWQFEQADPKDALETYLHEYRHTEQYYEVQKTHVFGAQDINIERLSAIEQSLGENYLSPKKDQVAYERQFVERDAEGFGTTAAMEILSRRDHLRANERSEVPITSAADAASHKRLIKEGSA